MFNALWEWLRGSSVPQLPAPSEDSSPTTSAAYSQMTKHYVFNETGNIMLCATEDGIHNFEEDIKNSFIDISVFFSAMTKAIHSMDTKNPLTGKPYTIYNYQIVKQVLESSGLFVEMNVEEGVFSSEKVGADLGKDLIQTVLNRDFRESRLHFSKAMFNGMKYQNTQKDMKELVPNWEGLNKEERLSHQRTLNQNGSIFFIGELLLGLPQVSAVLVQIVPSSNDDYDEVGKDITELGSWDERTHENKGNERSWNFKKRTYLFVPPQFFKHNSSALSDSSSPEYENFVESMTRQLEGFVKKENKKLVKGSKSN